MWIFRLYKKSFVPLPCFLLSLVTELKPNARFYVTFYVHYDLNTNFTATKLPEVEILYIFFLNFWHIFLFKIRFVILL